MKCGVVVFPGSNCDHDVYHVLKHVLGQDVRFLWHGDDTVKGSDLVILPGGFSYGDYLRAGAMAASSPVMDAIREFAADGGLVIGICNGFQVLTEAGLLPGALMRNQNLRFVCKDVRLSLERNDLPFTHVYEKGQVVKMPIAHAEGRFTAPEEVLDEIEAKGQVVFRYVDRKGERTDEANPNGSARGIAGVCNEAGNVFGLMPHPERCSEVVLGNRDGLGLFAAVTASDVLLEVVG